MTGSERFPRPPTPPGFDPSRASQRAAEPTGWRYPDDQREVVYRVIAERRDVRRFRPDEVPDSILEGVLAAAHSAPSVGLMQPWRLIVIRDLATRTAVRRLAQRERLRQAGRFDARAREFLDKKIEGVVEAPLGICVCCDHGQPDAEILGRGTIPETDVYSTCCAIENLWLAARAEGLGVGWVSFYRPADLRTLLDIPHRVDPIAYLCLGWPDERPVRPSLEAAGWSSRLPLDAVTMRERWCETESEATGATSWGTAAARDSKATGVPASQANCRPAAPRSGPDRAAAATARDRLEDLVKPAGSLGVLEAVIERWAAITGGPPPARVRAGVLVCAADHGHVRHRTSLFDSAVSAQVAAAAARAETAVGVLARHGRHELLIADVGLIAPTPQGLRDAKIVQGSADMTSQPALSHDQLAASLQTGAAFARELKQRESDCLLLGEIGIGNTTTSAALACALTGSPPQTMVGRGTGMDSAGLERKRAVVTRALERHGSPLPVRKALLALGGLELAALTGATLEAARLRLPVVLDGYAVTVAALAAVHMQATVAETLIAGHRSAEPGHHLLLAELGLEPLLDLRLRLGESSGALLALPLIQAAGALYADMGIFEETHVARPR
jgi:nicotinate-nucleotide--dimethylbenzimidazole phosphoribosyltransferase